MTSKIKVHLKVMFCETSGMCEIMLVGNVFHMTINEKQETLP